MMYGEGTKVRASRVMGRAAARCLDEDGVAQRECERWAEIAYILREKRHLYNSHREIRPAARARRIRARRAARKAHPRNK